MHKLGVLAAVVAAALLLAACGDDDDDTGGSAGDLTENAADDDGSPTATAEEPAATTAAPEPDGGAGSAADNPVPLGESGVLDGRMEIRVAGVNFDGEDIVLAADQDNEATPGKSMVLIDVDITNVGDPPLDALFDPFWNLAGDKGTVYDEFTPSCGVVPGELEGELLTGESNTGTVCVQADEDDSGLVFFVQMFDEDFDVVSLYLALE